MQDLIIGIINQYGYLGILLLIALENIFPPDSLGGHPDFCGLFNDLLKT